MGVLAVLLLLAPVAGADDGGRVYVDPAIPNAPAITARIAGQLSDTDTIAVKILTERSTGIPAFSTSDILIVAANTRVAIMSVGRMPQVAADEILARAGNVAINPVDRVIVAIRAIHAWQSANPPPQPPKPPLDLTWLWTTLASGALVAGMGWLVWRRRKRIAELAARADAQIDWSIEDYINKEMK